MNLSSRVLAIILLASLLQLIVSDYDLCWSSSDEVVASVNGVNISKGELDRAFSTLTAQNRLSPTDTDEQKKNAALEQLIFAELMYQKGNQTEPRDLAQQIEFKMSQNRAKFSTPEQFQDALKSSGVDEKDLAKITRKDIVISNYIETRITPTITVSDSEIREFYNKNQQRLGEAESIRASHILCGVDASATPEEKRKSREKAEALLNRLKRGENFADLARANSTCPSKEQGGDLGFFGKGQMVHSFEEAAFSLKPDELSKVVETQFGFHIIKVTEVKGSNTPPLSEFRDKIAAFLKGQKVQMAVLEHVKELRKQADVRISADREQVALQSEIPKPPAHDTSLLASGIPAPPAHDTSPPAIMISSPEVRRGVALKAKGSAVLIAGKASSDSGIAEVTVNGQQAALDENGDFSADILLKVGDNAIIVTAKDINNRKTVERFNIAREPGQPVKHVSTVDSSKSIFSSAYHALIIGNNDYVHLDRLKTAENDARQLGNILKEQFGFQTKLLLNATRSQIKTALNDLAKRVKSNDSVLIYYAGHGEFDRTAEKAYWLPVDAQRDNDTEWIIADDITTSIKRLSAKHVLIVSDSCYSGTLTRSSQTNLLKPAEREEFLNKMMDRPSRTLMASGGNEPVADGGGSGHSIFADSFLKALKDMDRSAFAADELFYQHVKSRVAGKSDQVPQYSEIRNSGHEGGDFIFVRK